MASAPTMSRATTGAKSRASRRVVSRHTAAAARMRPSRISSAIRTIITLLTEFKTKSTSGICRQPTE